MFRPLGLKCHRLFSSGLQPQSAKIWLDFWLHGAESSVFPRLLYIQFQWHVFRSNPFFFFLIRHRIWQMSVLTVCLLTAVQLEIYADESWLEANVKRPLAPSGRKGSDRPLTAALAYFQTGVTLLALRCPYHVTPRKHTQDCNPPLWTSVPVPEYSVSYLILCYQPPQGIRLATLREI